MKALAIAAVMAIAGVARAPAQVWTPRDPLALPVAAILCHSSKLDSGVVMLQAMDLEDSAAVREITVAFDSSGVPLFISVFAPERSPLGRIQTRAFAVRFGSAPAGLRGILEEDSSAVKDSVPAHRRLPASREPMSDSELSRARALAIGLHSRHCGDPQ